MRTIVLGGGISGLSSAYYLLRNSTGTVKVIEKSARLGGWVKTIKDPETGVLFEKGPRTIRPAGEQGLNTLALAEDLGLSEKIKPIPRSHPTAKNRLIYTGGQLHALPSDLLSMFKKLPPFSKPLALSLIHDLFSAPKKCHDDSIYDFAARRFGKDIADFAISPMICGICAGNAKEISVKFLLSNFFELEQKYGGVIKGYFKNPAKFSGGTKVESSLIKKAQSERWSVWGLEGGMETFPKFLAEKIKSLNGDILTGESVSKIVLSDKIQCTTDKNTYECDHIISTLPSSVLGQLIEKDHPELAKDLVDIPSVNVAVINLVYEKNSLKQNAFGFLVPPAENLPILGVIFDSCSFPQGNHTVLTAMLGGHWFQQYFGDNSSEEFVLDLTLKEINKILGINSKPVSYHFSVLKQCIPQYVIGHFDRVERIESYIENNRLPLSIAGSSFRGVGINDVILSGKKAAEKIMNK